MRVVTILMAATIFTAGSPAAVARTVKQEKAKLPPTPAYEALQAGVARIAARDPVAAQSHFQRALDLARVEGHRLIEGAAHRGLGTAFLHQDRYPLAKPEFDAAVAIFEELDSTANLAMTCIDLGNVEFRLGSPARARAAYLKALALVTADWNVRTRTSLYYNLSLVSPNPEERLSWIQQGLDLAKASGDLHNEGSLLHSWSDLLFSQGHLAESMEKVGLAVDRLTRADSRENLSRALTSLGRLHRAHGQHGPALESYRRALRIQEASSDRAGMIQSLNAMGIASSYLNRVRDARTFHERAVELARESASPSTIGWIVANLASLLIHNGEAARGVAMLEEVVTTSTSSDYQYVQLAAGYLELGQYDRAVESAARTIAVARQAGGIDSLRWSLTVRAHALEKLDRTVEALADAQEAVALVERVRADTVQTDAMKVGYAAEHDATFTTAIRLLQRLGRHREALDVAEKARGRAFADLLASRAAWATASADSASRGDEAANAGAGTSVQHGLATRGADSDRPATAGQLRREDGLQNTGTIPPLSSRELAGIAARLQSTIVSYWVGPEATYIWVVKGTGDVDAARVDVTEAKLIELVKRARSVRVRQTRTTDRGQPADPAVDDGDTEWMPRVRGAGLLSLGTDAVAASRSLHALLVEPIRHLLPSTPGSLLTIIPHGPLFQISFAALQDGSGRYLVERHAVHYAPAGVVLQLTDRQRRAPGPMAPEYLLIADPQSLPGLPDGKPLSRLPGSRREVGRVAELVGGSRVTTLAGAKATEEDVRRLAGHRSVIHFATHGVVRNDDPLESFLALDTGAAGSTVASPARDGRLTVREIYDLRLDADLVVLSACGTGLGKVSGDGVAGLARAFVYAGAPSVVATLWDLADEPAAHLMPQFYRSLKRQPDKAQALRDAQLKLLRDLRSGRVKVSTASGAATLQEHPVLWGGFVLVGER